MKVYVLNVEELFETMGEYNHTPRVFMKKEDAIAELNRIKEEVKEELSYFDTIDESETYIDMYDEGNRLTEHYSAIVYEVEVEE